MAMVPVGALAPAGPPCRRHQGSKRPQCMGHWGRTGANPFDPPDQK